MKNITNWRNATVADIESDALLDLATKIHVLSYKMVGKQIGSIAGIDSDRLVKFFEYHILQKIPLVMHNGITFDIPLAEKILNIDLSEIMVVDTLAISWYLNISRQRHGLDSFLDDYGIAKPKIDDWENLSYEEYLFRCETDVQINTALWEDFMERLTDMYFFAKDAVDKGRADGTRVSSEEVCYIDQYKNSSTVDDYIDRVITFLCHKLDIARLKEKTRFKADVEYIDKSLIELSGLIEKSTLELEGVMPQVPKYTKKNYPAKPFKKDGSLSASGISWNEALNKVGEKDEAGNDLAITVDAETLKILSKYEPPNINGHQQIKDFLFSKGWKPESFKFDVKDEDKAAWAESGYKKHLKPVPRKIPQINIEGENGKELCPSVLRLAEEVPEIMAYAKYSVIKHRFGVLTGFKRDMSEDGYLKAGCGGFTNTLREQHRELVNLVSVSKPFGEYIRGSLIAEEGQVLCGSDMSGLEDRIKHHFMIPHDPEYVATMTAEGYDPHLSIAVMAGLMSQEDSDQYKLLKANKNKSEEEKVIFDALGKIRQAGKSGNYSCQYGAAADTLARTAKIALSVAKAVVEGYKKLNWAIGAIAEDQCVIMDSLGMKWLVNPINGFLYSIRSEKDRFSTLCQGTGSFMFDMWIDRSLQKMYEKWKVKRVSYQAHDEGVFCFRDTEQNKTSMEQILHESVQELNEVYKLRRPLGVDVQFGKRYSEIH